MLRILVLLFLAILPATAHSGAWPREKRTVFLSWSNSISINPQTPYATSTSIYAEYGLTDSLTVGFDGNLGAPGETSEAYLFLRFPIGKTDRPAHTALTFALGGKFTPNPWGDTIEQPMAKIGASWGRGLKRGWLAVDAYAITALDTPELSFSADFTWGQKPSDRLMLIWQVQTGTPANGATYIKFAPSLIWTIGGKKSNQIEIGFVKGLIGDDSQNLKLGFWKTF